MNGSYLDFMQVRELGHLGYRRHAPNPNLSDWVQCLWQLNGSALSPSVEKLYPDGGTSLIFDFSENAGSPYYFSALHEVCERRIGEREALLGIRFLPGGATALLGIDVAEHAGLETPADFIHIPGLFALYEQLLSLSTSERIDVLQQWLLNKAMHAQTSIVPTVYRRMCAQEQSVEQLLEGSSLSRRKLERLFKVYVGMAPKQLSRLLRVRQARYLIKLNPARSLIDVALDAGFYDQPHFSRHFRKVTGSTPGEYQKRQNQKLSAQGLRSLW
jgi:AraC-like DNA-binding protein